MRIVDGETYLTIGEVSKIIDRGPQTIKNWYAWQEREQANLLPNIYTHLDEKRTRYFKEDDVHHLIKFRDSIRYGMMADFNREKWGLRGKEIQQNKDEES